MPPKFYWRTNVAEHKFSKGYETMIPRRIAAFSSPPSKFTSWYLSRCRRYQYFSTETNGGASSISDANTLSNSPLEGPLIINFERQSQIPSDPRNSPRGPFATQSRKDQPLTQLEQYQAQKAARETANKLGATLEPHYKPHELITNPPSPGEITLELLLASGAHLGHATALWNPGNQRYIFGIRQGIHLISLDIIAAHLRRAAKIVHAVSRKGGIIIFVGTRDGQERAVVEAARRTMGYHITERWVPGTITNKDQLLVDQKLRVLDNLDREVKLTGEQKRKLQEIIANEKGNQDVIHDTLQVPHSFGAIRPDLIVCLNPLENQTMLQECAQYRIPTIGIIDTDVDPTCVTYPIPANDDSLRAVQLIAGVLGRAGQEGRLARYEDEGERQEELERRQKRADETKQREDEEIVKAHMHREAEEAASEARQREIEQESELQV
ncbi:hypothetical protein H072_3533 [Dactylellina haptotyla CBS 200.50]|uniref:Ribosomal protein S2 n=1 Tax=Dactylellina haptotyla (strain CBS 200.50) TaxID=1284197 RepID=S8AMZ1_DACHA|nr:hypothetical protein H072_3533 [Dactylellina haptotyla CBS 200.50]